MPDVYGAVNHSVVRALYREMCSTDLEQREGRIIRQGNENSDVDVYRYVTEGTFDAYLYQMIENKQRFISQIMTSKSPVRSCEDVDEATLSYAEVKALCAGNPLIKEKMDLDVSVAKLKMLKSNYTSQQYALEDSIRKDFPKRILAVQGRIEGLEKDLEHFKSIPDPEKGISPMKIGDNIYTDKETAGKALMLALKTVKSSQKHKVGTYKGFDMMLSYDSFNQRFELDLRREMAYSIVIGDSEGGNITRIDNALECIPKHIENSKAQLEGLHQQLEAAKSELGKPFPQEKELAEKSARLAQLNIELNIDKSAKAEGMEQDEKPSIFGQIGQIKSEQTRQRPQNREHKENGLSQDL